MIEKDLALFILACEKPGLFVPQKNYECVCAFIDGYNMAMHGACLAAFRQWLLLGSDTFSTAPWWLAIRMELFPNSKLECPLTDDESKLALDHLVLRLRGYSDAIQHIGLEGIFQEFSEWKRTVLVPE